MHKLSKSSKAKHSHIQENAHVHTFANSEFVDTTTTITQEDTGAKHGLSTKLCAVNNAIRVAKRKLTALAVAAAMAFTPLVALDNAVAAPNRDVRDNSVAESIIIDKGGFDGSKVVRPDDSHSDLPIFANYLNGFRGTGPGAKNGDLYTNAQVKIISITGDRRLFTITFEYSGTSSLFLSEPKGLSLQKSDGNGGYVDNPTYEILAYDADQLDNYTTLEPSDILTQKEPYRVSSLSGAHNDFYRGYMSFMQYDDNTQSFTQNPLTHAENYQYRPAAKEDFPALMSFTQPYDITPGINNVYIYNPSRFDHKRVSLTFKVKEPFKYGYGASYPVRITAYLAKNQIGRYSYSNWANYATVYYNAPVIYCLNRYFAFPPSNKEINDSEGQLKQVDYSTDNYFSPVVPSPKYNDATKNQIAWIMRLGYPYDGAKFFSNSTRQGVPEDEQGYYFKAYEQTYYEKATQQAIWHLTDNVPIVEKKIDSRANFVINKLLELSKKKVEEDKKKQPQATADDSDKFETYYLDNNNHKVPDAPKLYQNFIGLRYKDPRDPIKGKVKIAKYDGPNDSPIMSGAKFDLYEGHYHKSNPLNAKKIAENLSISDGKLEIDNLKINQAYTLDETVSPLGFQASDPVIFRIAQIYRSIKRLDEGSFYETEPQKLYRLEKFSVNDASEPSWIPLQDENGVEKPAFNFEELSTQISELRIDNYPPIDLIVAKLDGIRSTSLSGAQFKLVEGRNPDETPIANGTWTSETARHTITIAREKVYTLVETKAPEGYHKSRPITFKVDKDGAIYKFDGALQYLYSYPSADPLLAVKNYPESVPTLMTRAAADGQVASEGNPIVLQGTQVNGARDFKDTLIYNGLVPHTPYTITTTLWELHEDGTKGRIQKQMTSEFTPEESSGEHTVNFGDNYQDIRLYANKQGRYLFTEKIESKVPVLINGKMQNQVLIHDDPFDKAQTIETTSNSGIPPFVSSEDGSLKTVVKSGENTADASTPLKIGNESGSYSFVDTVSYTGLRANEPYTVTAELMDMSTDNPSRVGDPVIKHFTPSDDQVSGTLEMSFSNYPLEAGKRYIVWEKIESDNPILEKKTVDPYGDMQTSMAKHTLLEHEKNAISQTIVMEQPENPNTPREGDDRRNSEIRTTVILNSEVASTTLQSATISPTLSQTDSGLSFIDRVQYKDLKAGMRYAVVGQLMKVDGTEVTPVENATGSTIFIARAGDDYFDENYVDVAFNHVKNLEKSAKYVVYEAVVPVDQVELDNSSTHVKTPFATVSAMENAVKHEDKSDLAQILLTDNTDLQTTVVVEGSRGSSTNVLRVYGVKGNLYTVKDEIILSHTTPGLQYQLFGRIVEKASKKVVKEIKLDTLPADNIVDFGKVMLKPNVEYVITEAVVPSTNRAANYSEALSKPKLIIHENFSNKAQTFLITWPEIKTTVHAYANDKKKAAEASSQNELQLFESRETLKQGVPVVDVIAYRGLDADQHYVAYGRLMRVEEGKDPVEVAHKSTTFTAKAGDAFNSENTVTVDFGMLQNLEPGKYVVFESVSAEENAHLDDQTGVVSFANQSMVIKHENINDKAQTLIITRIPDSELKTVVTADGVSATMSTVSGPASGDASGSGMDNSAGNAQEASLTKTPEELAAGIQFTDKVFYKDFVDGVKYTLFGKLMKVANAEGDDLATPQEIATAWQIFTAKGNPEYSDDNVLNLDFGLIKNLEAGKYVVYEYAAPAETTLINGKHVNMEGVPNYNSQSPTYPSSTSGINQTVNFTDAVLEHADSSDKAQTVILMVNIPDDSMGAVKTTVSAKLTEDNAATVTAGSEPANISATDEQLTAGVNITDKVFYKGLIPSKMYHLFGQLQKVADNTGMTGGDTSADQSSAVQPVGDIVRASFTAGEHADNTEWSDENAYDLRFGVMQNLEAGKYVVYEVLVPDALLKKSAKTADQITTLEQAKEVLKNAASSENEDTSAGSSSGGSSSDSATPEKYAGFVHENPDDKAQTLVITRVILPAAVLRTVVSSGESISSSTEPFTLSAGQIPLVDTVSYEHLKPGVDYVVYGRLMRVDDPAAGVSDPAGSTVSAVDHASAYVVFTADSSGAGDVRVDFGTLDLPEGTYVVFETASVASNAHIDGVDKLTPGMKGTDKTVTFSKDGLVAKHEDADDKAQTFILAELSDSYDDPPSPTEPSNPSEPEQPEHPSEPEQPSNPEKPAEPEEPEHPMDPSEPVHPSEPEQPVEPERPSDPSEPSEPSEPSTPEEPSDPEEPATPELPVEPKQPEEPEIPLKPSESGKPNLPNTGSSVFAGVLSVTLLSVISAAVIILRKRLRD